MVAATTKMRYIRYPDSVTSDFAFRWNSFPEIGAWVNYIRVHHAITGAYGDLDPHPEQPYNWNQNTVNNQYRFKKTHSKVVYKMATILFAPQSVGALFIIIRKWLTIIVVISMIACKLHR